MNSDNTENTDTSATPGNPMASGIEQAHKLIQEQIANLNKKRSQEIAELKVNQKKVFAQVENAYKDAIQATSLTVSSGESNETADDSPTVSYLDAMDEANNAVSAAEQATTSSVNAAVAAAQAQVNSAVNFLQNTQSSVAAETASGIGSIPSENSNQS